MSESVFMIEQELIGLPEQGKVHGREALRQEYEAYTVSLIPEEKNP